jgi:hypothetical protein
MEGIMTVAKVSTDKTDLKGKYICEHCGEAAYSSVTFGQVIHLNSGVAECGKPLGFWEKGDTHVQ